MVRPESYRILLARTLTPCSAIGDFSLDLVRNVCFPRRPAATVSRETSICRRTQDYPRIEHFYSWPVHAFSAQSTITTSGLLLERRRISRSYRMFHVKQVIRSPQALC